MDEHILESITQGELKIGDVVLSAKILISRINERLYKLTILSGCHNQKPNVILFKRLFFTLT